MVTADKIGATEDIRHGGEPTEPPESIEEPQEQPAPLEEPEPWKPDEVYKGMQRELQRAKDEARTLREQLDQAQRQPAAGLDPLAAHANNQAQLAYQQQIAAGVPDEQARQYRDAVYQAWYSGLRLQQMETERQQEEGRRAAHEAARALTAEMRDVAAIAGVDPDDPGLYYGDESSADAAERMRAFKPSLRAAQARIQAQRPAQPQRAPDRSGGRVDREGPTAPPTTDAEAKKQAFLRASQEYRQGIGGHAPAELKRLKDEALAAGATFEE